MSALAFVNDATISKTMTFTEMEEKLFVCPFCGSKGPLGLMGADRFPILSWLHVIGAGRRAARCPNCFSTDKERLLFTYVKEFYGKNKLRESHVLHIAPENNLAKWLLSNSLEYIAGDAFLQDQQFEVNVSKVDIKKTSFPTDYFDLIICCHVICDIKEDSKAISELYRILSSDGVAILQVPITKDCATVVKDVHTKAEREEAYGYGYHERIYSQDDYVCRLRQAGFVVEIRNISKDFPLNGLNFNEDLYLCRKSKAS